MSHRTPPAPVAGLARSSGWRGPPTPRWSSGTLMAGVRYLVAVALLAGLAWVPVLIVIMAGRLALSS